MPAVKVTEFRNTIYRIRQQLRVDRHACKGLKEIAVWCGILERTLQEAQNQTCLRACIADQRNHAMVVAAGRMALLEARDRIDVAVRVIMDGVQ